MSLLALLQYLTVRVALQQAWAESNPGILGGKEQGGFFCITQEGTLTVDRWQTGKQDQILAPPHPGGKRNGEIIVATFHTHPNTGKGYYQTPSPGDRQAVLRDQNLKHSEYAGEFVISEQNVNGILPNGDVVVIGQHDDLLGAEELK